MALKFVSPISLSPTPVETAGVGSVGTLLPFVAGLVFLLAVRWRSQRNGPFSVFLKVGVVMALIGILGATIDFLHQPWLWTRTLGALPAVDVLALLTLAALLLGAMTSGVVSGRFKLVIPTLKNLRDRVIGGTLMGAGIALVPGGNDALILRSIPSGSLPGMYGYALMLLAIALTLRLRGGIFPASRKPVKTD